MRSQRPRLIKSLDKSNCATSAEPCTITNDQIAERVERALNYVRGLLAELERFKDLIDLRRSQEAQAQSKTIE